MKKSFKLVSLLAVAGSVFFSSCSKDEETVTPTKTYFTTTTTDTLWNNAGPYKGSYDLVTGDNVSSSTADASKDLFNNTDLTVSANGFNKGWTAKNGTEFYYAGPATAANFDNVSKEYVDSVSTAASSSFSGTVSNVAANNVYFVKLRGASTKAVIKVVSITDDSKSGVGFNNDYILFTYKK